MIRFDDIEGTVILLPKSFLENFSKSDRVKVCGDLLYAHWGMERFILCPQKSVITMYGASSHAKNWWVHLDAHRACCVPESEVSDVLADLHEARQYKRRICFTIKEV